MVAVTITVVVLGVVATVAVTRREHLAASAAALRLPTHLATRWTTTVPGEVWNVSATGGVVLATAHGARPVITAVAASDGAELWSRSDEVAMLATVGVLGDTVLLVSSPRRGDDDIVGLDVHTGTERWRRPLSAVGSSVWLGGQHVIISRPAPADATRIGGVDLLDAGDGTIRASLDGPDVRATADDVQVPRRRSGRRLRHRYVRADRDAAHPRPRWCRRAGPHG